MNKLPSGECSQGSLPNLNDDELTRQIEELSRDLASGVASEKTGKICTTAQDAAKELGVSLTAFQSWSRMEGFPGRPGGNNQRNAYMPIDEIREWHLSRFGTNFRAAPVNGRGDDLRSRKLAAEVGQREAKLRQQLGQVVDLDMAVGLWAQAVASARSKLEEIPEAIADSIPPTKPKMRRRVAGIARGVVQRVLLELAELILSHIDRDDIGEDERDSNGDESRRQNRVDGTGKSKAAAAPRRR